MPNGPSQPSWSPSSVTNLVSQASSILAREASRLAPGTPGATFLGSPPLPAVPSAPGLGAPLHGKRCPVTGAVATEEPRDRAQVQQQAHDLLASVFAAFSQGNGAMGLPSPDGAPSPLDPAGAAAGVAIGDIAGRVCPVTGAMVPVPGTERDRVRRQAHELIEALLVTFNRSTSEQPAPFEDQVPLLHAAAPVLAGGEGSASLTIMNEEASPSDVSLYSSNFVADSGYEIPSLRVTFSPRRLTIPAGQQATFQIRVTVPMQTPPGIYSGLVQAMGTKYVKAVLSVEVR
jgi:hypothetical protein